MESSETPPASRSRSSAGYDAARALRPGRGPGGRTTSTSPAMARSRSAASATWSSAATSRSTRSPDDLGLEVVGGVRGDDPALVDDHDPVAERVGLVEVVRGQEHRRAALACAAGRCAPTGWPAPAGPGRWSARRGTPASGRGSAPSRCRAGASGRPTCSSASGVHRPSSWSSLEELAARGARRPPGTSRRASRGPSTSSPAPAPRRRCCPPARRSRCCGAPAATPAPRRSRRRSRCRRSAGAA